MERQRARNGRFTKTRDYIDGWPRKSISELRGWLLSDPSVVVGESTRARGLHIVWRKQPNGASPSILLHCMRCEKNRRYLYHENRFAFGEARYVCPCKLGLSHEVCSLSKAERIQRKMWGIDALLENGKPKRMRWRTYERLLSESNYLFVSLWHPSIPMGLRLRKAIWGTTRVPR